MHTTSWSQIRSHNMELLYHFPFKNVMRLHFLFLFFFTIIDRGYKRTETYTNIGLIYLKNLGSFIY